MQWIFSRLLVVPNAHWRQTLLRAFHACRPLRKARARVHPRTERCGVEGVKKTLFGENSVPPIPLSIIPLNTRWSSTSVRPCTRNLRPATSLWHLNHLRASHTRCFTRRRLCQYFLYVRARTARQCVWPVTEKNKNNNTKLYNISRCCPISGCVSDCARGLNYCESTAALIACVEWQFKLRSAVTQTVFPSHTNSPNWRFNV